MKTAALSSLQTLSDIDVFAWLWQAYPSYGPNDVNINHFSLVKMCLVKRPYMLSSDRPPPIIKCHRVLVSSVSAPLAVIEAVVSSERRHLSH